MKKLIIDHVYPKNGARLAVSYVDNVKGVPACDSLLVEITSITRKRKSTTGHFMRPDEALKLAALLVAGVHDITIGYTVANPKKERKR